LLSYNSKLDTISSNNNVFNFYKIFYYSLLNKQLSTLYFLNLNSYNYFIENKVSFFNNYFTYLSLGELLKEFNLNFLLNLTSSKYIYNNYLPLNYFFLNYSELYFLN